MLTINKPGLLSIIVGQPRTGWQHLGICSAGPMDSVAYSAAQVLTETQAVAKQNALEIIGEFEASVDKPAVGAVCGPGEAFSVNGKTEPSWHTVYLKRGDSIKINSPKFGQRQYFSVSGGFNIQPVKGSVTCSLREQLGGHLGIGTALQAGDILPFDSELHHGFKTKHITPPDYALTSPIRFIPGYQIDQLGTNTSERFCLRYFAISPDSNRMGYRLDGPLMRHCLTNMMSQGMGLGAIQLPSGGQPIVMMTERQTLGGYPKIGSVARCDLHRLVQATPGEFVCFQAIDVYSAIDEWRALCTPLTNADRT